MKSALLALLALCVSVTSATSASASDCDRLQGESKQKFEWGETVILTEAVPDMPWPKVWVFKRVEAMPEEAAAVFWDVEYQTTYLAEQGVTKAEIRNGRGTATVDVYYELDLPALVGDDAYTVRDTLTAPAGDAYRVGWTMLGESRHSRSSVGYAKFEPQAAATCMVYYNLVHPKSGLAGLPLIRKQGIEKVGQTALAIARQAEAERTRDAERLRNQVARLRAALGR